jgi:hypothetical protein
VFSPQGNDGVKEEELYGIISYVLKEQEVPIPVIFKPYIKKELFRYIVPVGSDQEGPPSTALNIPNFRSQGVLIKKPKVGWVETTQYYCFLVINDNVQFDDEINLGRLLEESIMAKERYAISKTKYDHEDKALIRLWFLILQGRLPQDTPLE